MTTTAFDQTRAEAFAERLMESLNSSATMLMLSVGHRTRLFDVMADLPPSTSAGIADAAGLSERYVREWLGAMVAAEIVRYDAAAKTYALPAEHAAFLTRAATPNNLAGVAQWIAVLGAVEGEVVQAFGHGNGVPYEAYQRFHDVMAEESAQTVVAALEDHILPLAPGLAGRLEAGIDVLDVGCGAGLAMIYLAERYPRSRFVGSDFSREAISKARDEAERRELSNVRFEVADAAKLDYDADFDLVTTFDAVHDQADPARVLANIRRAVRPDGMHLMQDIKACSHVDGNIGHPFGAFIYTISCMHCMSVSLACGGAGLGAAWGKELALQMLQEAGFASEVHELEHDVMNYYYINTPVRQPAPAPA
ncbi:MAG: class I SAM-dependent methyltransferase [Phycisphaerales bacterium JB039]